MEELDQKTSQQIKAKRKRTNLVIAALITGFIVLVYFITLVKIGNL